MHIQGIVDGGGCTFEGSSFLGRGGIRRDDIMWRELVMRQNFQNTCQIVKIARQSMQKKKKPIKNKFELQKPRNIHTLHFSFLVVVKNLLKVKVES